MPAVAAKKPTAYREGRADKTKKPSIEIEINPEGEEEEEGMEGQEMDAAKTSRKRSAKGAKSTKAPMDGDCGCGGKKGASCDGNCGGYAKKMDRSDALTPQEYLAACDLGIQGRSRSYIRARLDAAERLDLKCGKGSISPGEKCTKGQAQAVDPKAATKKQPTLRDLRNDPYGKGAKFWKQKGSTAGIGNKVKRGGEFAANLGAGIAVARGTYQLVEGLTTGNIGQASRGLRNYSLGLSAGSLAGASRAARQGNTQLSKQFASQAGKIAAFGVGQEAALGAYAGFKRTGGMAGLKRRTRGAYQSARMRTSGMRSTPHGTGWASSAYDRPLRGRRDSIYAAGFAPELDQLAI
jgi:hypothetical protein